MKRTTFQENRRPDAGAIVDRKSLDVEYDASGAQLNAS
jgi:hypothetical protein